MKNYSFTTLWKIEAPVEAVWAVIKKSEAWPTWWKALRQVTLLRKGDASGVGDLTESVWRTALPYTLAFQFEVTEVVDFQKLAGRALGELDGTGVWTFSQEGAVTTVRYDWNVRTTKSWMNALSFLLEPVFHWNHDVVMRWGGEGLARKLQAELVFAS